MIASFAGLAPVWPPAVALLTSLFTLIAVIFSFQFFRRAAKQRVSAVMMRALAVMVAALLAYLLVFDTFTFALPTTGELIYVGCGWSELAKEVADQYLFDPKAGCPGDYHRVLAASEYESIVIWTRGGLTAVKMGLVMLWLGLFASVAIFIGAFLVYQSGR